MKTTLVVESPKADLFTISEELNRRGIRHIAFHLTPYPKPEIQITADLEEGESLEDILIKIGCIIKYVQDSAQSSMMQQAQL